MGSTGILGNWEGNSSGSTGIPWDLKEYLVTGRLGMPYRNSSGSMAIPWDLLEYSRCTVDRSTPIDQQGLEHILAANAAEISRGLSWAKTAGLVQQAKSSPTMSGNRDLQGAGWGQNRRLHRLVCNEYVAELLTSSPEGDETNQSGSSQPCSDFMF